MHLPHRNTDVDVVRLPTGLPGLGAACAQLIGSREEQQDAWGLCPAGTGLLAVVADGMGGMARGGAAAVLAVQQACEAARDLPGVDATFEQLHTLLQRCDRAVYRGIDVGGIIGLAGTTLCAVLANRNRARIFWCGDSRVYLLRGGHLHPLTEDHTYARYLRAYVEEGILRAEQAAGNPRRDHLTGYLGIGVLEDYSITTTSIAMERGDRLLLCTDGLYRGLDEGTIAALLRRTPTRACGGLIRMLDRRQLPGQDNATALVLGW